MESTNLTWPPESCSEPAEPRPPPPPPSATMLRCSDEPESVRVWGRGRLDADAKEGPAESGVGACEKERFNMVVVQWFNGSIF